MASGTRVRRLSVLEEDRRRVAGVEHEYIVRDGAGAPIDARQVLATVSRDRRLDPGDPYAQRRPWGGVVTADGPEAEIATAPVPLGPGCTEQLDAACRAGLVDLGSIFGSDHAPEGFSTHLNVEVPRRDEVRVARRLVARHGAALALLIDQPSSPGVLVRPRPGRLEVGGEYVAGDGLRAAMVVIAGLAHHPGRMPARVRRDRADPAVERYGWFVSHAGAGFEPGSFGRASVLHRRGPVGVTAGDQLARTWEQARPGALEWAGADEVGLVDGIVDGRFALPCEDPDTIDRWVDRSLAGDPAWRIPELGGRDVRARRRPGFVAAPEVMRWGLEVWRVRQGSVSVVVAVPRPWAESFEGALDRGDLDRDLQAALAAAPTGRMLLSASQVEEPSIFDGLGDPEGLIDPERDVATGRYGGRGGRPDDHKSDRPQPPARRPRRPPRRMVAAAVVGVLVLVVLAAGAAAVRDRLVGDGAPRGSTGSSGAAGTTNGSGGSGATGGGTESEGAGIVGSWSDGTTTIEVTGEDGAYEGEVIESVGTDCPEGSTGARVRVTGGPDTFDVFALNGLNLDTCELYATEERLVDRWELEGDTLRTSTQTFERVD